MQKGRTMSITREFEEMSLMSAAVISGAMSRLGLRHRTMHSHLKPVFAGIRLAGTAATAESREGPAPQKSL